MGRSAIFHCSGTTYTISFAPVPAEGEVGRYQVAIGGATSTTTIVLDTVTGETWTRSYDRNIGRTMLRSHAAGPQRGSK